MEREYTFEGQRQDEKVLVAVKAHPFILFWPGLKSVLLWSMGAALLIFWPNQYSSLITLVLILIGLLILSGTTYRYSQNYFVVTNQRLIKIEQSGMAGHKISECDLEHVQEMSSDTTGLFRGLLNFGDLRMRISDEAKDIEMVAANISRPYEVQERISGAKKEEST